VAISGIAGPGGAAPGKPVGTVWFGVAVRPPDGARWSQEHRRTFSDAFEDGGRSAVRAASIRTALELALRACQHLAGDAGTE